VEDKPQPLARRIELKNLPLTSEFAVEKRGQDGRGQAHLIVDDRPICRVCLLTLNPGTGFRGSHMHRNKHEGFYVVSGRAQVELVCQKSKERLTLDLGPGDRLWLPPKVAHRISAVEPLCFVEMTERPYDPEDDRPFEF
jgi:L-fuculose-phosphate aldolase